MSNNKLQEWIKDKGSVFLVFSPFIAIGVALFSPTLAFFIILPICIIYLLAFIFSLFNGDLFSSSGDKYGGDDGGG